MKSNLLVCYAMESEVDPEAVKGILDNPDNLGFLKTGIGPVNAAISLTKYLCDNPHVTHIFNVGFVGSKPGQSYKIGDLVEVWDSLYWGYDPDIYNQSFFRELDHFAIKWSDRAPANCLTNNQFYTGQSLGKTSFATVVGDRPLVFDMELAALSQAVESSTIPQLQLYSVKLISDTGSVEEYQSLDSSKFREKLNRTVIQFYRSLNS